MIASKWSWWGFILRRLARTQGFLDPTAVFARLQRFSQPSEVWVPTELLRSGAVLQARGLINSQAIQHNLEWIWPFWVERQFNPKDEAFIPRAFSMTHINLTHRNWTAIGLPDYPDMPIVDPRGLLTPFFDGWSLDAWIIADRCSLIPSRLVDVHQEIRYDPGLKVLTRSKKDHFVLEVESEVINQAGFPMCETSVRASVPSGAWLAVAVRPYNPEGISPLNTIKRLGLGKNGWNVNDEHDIVLSCAPQHYLFSKYDSRDLYTQIKMFPHLNILDQMDREQVSCPAGMASAAALYPVDPGYNKEVVVHVPLSNKEVKTTTRWEDHLNPSCRLKIPDKRFSFLYETALRTLILHSPGDVVYPGPFTYKRFWFRDAAYILHAMITAGLLRNVKTIIDHFHVRQEKSGYFLSQDGEWDSNGQALWIMQRFCAMTDSSVDPQWLTSVYQAARWIQWKRLPVKDKSPHSGLMPAGFSAEHFGPSDYYYWDDYWSAAGLRAAAWFADERHPDLKARFSKEADDLLHSVEQSLAANRLKFGHNGLSPSPYRRMDAASIGTLVAGYPLQIYSERDEALLKTVDYLLSRHVLHGGFYHEISHSGINIYLTLHIAQVLLRAGSRHFIDVVEAAANLATSTGQWPEAIHPRTKGGCMGDGQHVWAAAEWVLMLRNMFVREEEQRRTLVLCSGIPPAWLQDGEPISFGPTQTIYGPVTVKVRTDPSERVHISWDARWYREAPQIEIRWPGRPIVRVAAHERECVIPSESARETALTSV